MFHEARTLAGNEDWALKYARQQFGDDVTVEPGRTAPGPKERAKAPKKEKDPGKLSALDAAAKVLAETGRAMTCQELIGAMAAKGYWSSPAGKTPAATLYSAMLRETTTKGEQARFVKAARSQFALRTLPHQA
ncbi:MAG TPA: winged helix-turn-helix domain-containing protein [Gemmataceae bacterium]|nr:winged helix-turn-helix domain-containing protein [Gemmataceae bacterium]